MTPKHIQRTAEDAEGSALRAWSVRMDVAKLAVPTKPKRLVSADASMYKPL